VIWLIGMFTRTNVHDGLSLGTYAACQWKANRHIRRFSDDV